MAIKIVLLALLASYGLTWLSGIYNVRLKKEGKNTKLHFILGLVT